MTFFGDMVGSGIVIATDTKYVWVCLNPECSCLFTKEVRDNNPALEDCIYCDGLRFIEKGRFKNDLVEELELKVREEVRVGES
jgi:hypothetical protein